MHEPHENNGSKRRPALACPLCRKALAGSQGPDGAIFECAGAHVFNSQSLLQEQDRHVTRVLRELEGMLESKIAVSTDLAARANEEGRRHLVLYLEGEIEDARRQLAIVSPCLHDDPN